MSVTAAELHSMLTRDEPDNDLQRVRLVAPTETMSEADAKARLAAFGRAEGWLACASTTWWLAPGEATGLEDEILLGAELVEPTERRDSLQVRAAGAGEFLVSRIEETLVDGTEATHLREDIALAGEGPVGTLVYARYWSTTEAALTHAGAARLVALLPADEETGS